MSIKTKLLAVMGFAVLMFGTTAALADLEVTPYGAVQYRLRFQYNRLDNRVFVTEGEEGNERLVERTEKPTSFDYSNRISYRVGLKAKWDEQLSLQFQIGNDWGAAENVTWTSNNAPNGRMNENQHLYVHLASAKWDPGYMFLEAGVVPLNSNGTLDLLYSRQARGVYHYAGWNNWAELNNSMVGIKVGAPVVKGVVKVGLELFQSVLNPRSYSLNGNTTVDSVKNDPRPEEIITVVAVPADAGAFKITPEATVVWNRRYVKDGADLEWLVGGNASYKVSDGVSINVNGGYGSLDNGGTGNPQTLSGYLIGGGASIKAGPGTLQLAANHAATIVAVENRDDVTTGFSYFDLRYGVKVHSKVTLTPRYRYYHYGYPESSGNRTVSRDDHRVELIFDAAF